MNTQEISVEVINMAKSVYSSLGGGYLESAYENAMAIEFRQGNLKYDVQKVTEIFYKGQKIGEHQLDFIVEDKFVVELKAGTSITKSHTSQLRSYLKTLNLFQGIVINFPYPDKSEPDFEVISIE